MIRRDQSGVTLVELTLVMMLVILLAVATIPIKWNHILGDPGARGAAEQVGTAVQQTRTFAIMQNCTYAIDFASNQIAIAPSTAASDCASGSATQGPTAVIHDATVTTTTITFTSTGGSNGGSVVVTAPDNNGGTVQRTVQVSASGRVKVTTP